MSGATAKSKPDGSKLDERELARLRKQEYWLQVTLAKLVMDLIFVCEFIGNRAITRRLTTSCQPTKYLRLTEQKTL